MVMNERVLKGQKTVLGLFCSDGDDELCVCGVLVLGVEDNPNSNGNDKKDNCQQ